MMKPFKIRRNPSVLFKRRKDFVELILLHKNEDEMKIDGIAKDVWLAIDGTKTIPEILEEISIQQKLSENEKEEFEESMIEFFEELRKNSLIEDV